MRCQKYDCHSAHTDADEIFFPGTNDHNSPWRFYNHLIAGIPDDVAVLDYALGVNWTYLEAECGMGISHTVRGGAHRSVRHDLRGLPLKTVAELSKSWNFEEASIGVAALNAWYSRRELLDPLGARYDEAIELPDGSIRKLDAFEIYRPKMQGAKVTVVGHFPHVDRIAEYAELTVLERACSDELDTPDPACEYVLPSQDFVFLTGMTITNKTCPRLLDLSKDAITIITGPSVVPSEFLFHWGVETLAGSVVADPEKTRFAIKNGAGMLFGEAIQMMMITKSPQSFDLG